MAKSRDAAGNLGVSTNHTITTLPPNEAPTKPKKKKDGIAALFSWFDGLF